MAYATPFARNSMPLTRNLWRSGEKYRNE